MSVQNSKITNFSMHKIVELPTTDLYAVLCSAVQIYDEKTFVYFSSTEKKEVDSTRHLNQCNLSVWYYGSYKDCLNFIKSHKEFLENLSASDCLTDYEIVKEVINSNKELTSFSWVDKFNSEPYDFMKTLSISKLDKIIDYKDLNIK